MFNTRSRAFSGLWYWLAQIVGSLLFGWFLDNPFMTRRRRAIAGWALLFVLVLSIWGGGLKAELGISRPPDQAQAASWFRGMDIHDTDFTWYCLLYAFYGVLDAAWQTYAYWIMGALSNDPRKLAYFAGFYKVPPPPPPLYQSSRRSSRAKRESNRRAQQWFGASTALTRRSGSSLALRGDCASPACSSPSPSSGCASTTPRSPRRTLPTPTSTIIRRRARRSRSCQRRWRKAKRDVVAESDAATGHFFPPGYEREYVMLLVI